MTTENPPHHLGALERATSVVALFQALLLLLDVLGPGDSRPGLITVLAATLLLAAVNRRLAATSGDRPVSRWIVAWRIGTLALVAAITLLLALDRYSLVPDAAPHLLAMLMWSVVGLKGAAVGKLRPGGPLGLRVPWTLRSRLAWDRAHRLLGRVLFAGGLIGLAASPFVAFEVSIAALGALLAVVLPVALFESWRTCRADPEATT